MYRGWRGNIVIRQAPVAALLILIGVNLVGLGILLRSSFALVSVTPLVLILALFVHQLRSY